MVSVLTPEIGAVWNTGYVLAVVRCIYNALILNICPPLFPTFEFWPDFLQIGLQPAAVVDRMIRVRS